MELLGSPRRRRTALAVAAVAAALVATTLGVPSDQPASAADPRPALQLERARSTVVAERYGRTAYIDLGVHVVAGDDPFEVRVTRPDYAQPLRAVLVGPGGEVELPTGSADEGWSGLARFFTLKVTNSKGKRVATRSVAFCPNSEGQTRRRVDAPTSSPYPYGCGANPYGLGQVWGLQEGFSTPAVQGLELRLPTGLYRAELAVAAPYVQRLGLTGATSASVRVRVVKGKGDGWRTTGRTSGASGGSHHGAMSTMRHTEETWDDPRRASAYETPRKAEMRELPQRADGDGTALPDLRSLPAWSIEMRRGRYLQFAATVWNAGPSPLVVDAFRRGTNDELMDAYQYFYDAEGEQVGYDPVGTMEWDAREGHNHWHFTDFASYRLLDKDKNLVVRSSKEAFCLANTDAVDYTVPGANWRPDGTDLHTSCGTQGSVAVRQTLEAGSGDTYMQFLPGQSFDVKGLPNGTYYIEVLANPGSALHEASASNNSALRRVVLRGKAGKRTVSVAKVGVVDESGGEYY